MNNKSDSNICVLSQILCLVVYIYMCAILVIIDSLRYLWKRFHSSLAIVTYPYSVFWEAGHNSMCVRICVCLCIIMYTCIVCVCVCVCVYGCVRVYVYVSVRIARSKLRNKRIQTRLHYGPDMLGFKDRWMKLYGVQTRWQFGPEIMSFHASVLFNFI